MTRSPVYPQKHAILWNHGGLFRLSPGYTPVMGRLHTRYAPVRRSPTAYCYASLPLDLHVLSLPLAFILSQDQTLRCSKSFCIISLTVDNTALSYPILGLNYYFNVLLSLPQLPTIHISVLGCANVHTFLLLQTFFTLFLKLFYNSLKINTIF